MKIGWISLFLRLSLVLLISTAAHSAHAQFYRDAYVEAECPDSGTGSYLSRVTSITGFSGSGYVRSAANTTAATFNNTSADRAVYTFKAYRYGTFSPWFRVNTNNSASDDSFFFRIDGGGWTTVSSIPAGSGWRWVGAVGQYMGPGNHTIEIANREDGLNIDKLGMLYDGSAAPTGTGGPAYNCPTPMYFESECRTSGWGEYVWDKKAKAGFSGRGYLEASTTSTDVNTSAGEVLYPFESGAGAYNFFFRIHNNSNASNDSWFYRIDSGPWVTMNNTSGLGSGWRWAQGSASVTLTRGDHTLRIKNREALLSVDKLAFVPTTATGPSGTSLGGTGVNCEPFQTMSDWDYFEVGEYFNTHANYFAVYGDHMLSAHDDWHLLNGPGGTDGPGSGTAFMGFHRAMMNELRKFAMENDGRHALPISTVGLVIPPWLGDAMQALGAAGFSEEYAPRFNDQMTDWGLPSYLTVNATPSANWLNSSVWVGVNNYTRIGDMPDLDTLGQAIAVEYHASLHSAVGGTMSSFYSPADPIFYGWHGLIDGLADVWLATPKGQAWAAANPTHPFLAVGFTSHHGWDNADFAP
ncbi:MAG: hypothetical protein EOO73_19505 [Myxococcales bacterium]|nr:MAG: hypothetical protein EOO73_19505 [Myxococcales bacterium]